MFGEMFSWGLFAVLISGMFALDLFFYQKTPPSLKKSILWSAFWILLAFLFGLYIYYTRGSVDAINFFTGYLIEKSLSFDNLFVFLLIFEYFQTPPPSTYKVLFFGILGAILLRALFIGLGIVLISHFHFIIYLFGAFLVLTGIKLVVEKEKKINPEKNPIVKAFRALFPITDQYENGKFFAIRQSRYVATPLLVVLLSIETADVLFAMDSIPAVLAITSDPFIVYTSNIFALFGLRTLYFLLNKLKSSFYYMHFAVSVILVFVGVKMLTSDLFEISNLLSLSVILVILLISIVASIFFRPTSSK